MFNHLLAEHLRYWKQKHPQPSTQSVTPQTSAPPDPLVAEPTAPTAPLPDSPLPQPNSPPPTLTPLHITAEPLRYPTITEQIQPFITEQMPLWDAPQGE